MAAVGHYDDALEIDAEDVEALRKRAAAQAAAEAERAAAAAAELATMKAREEEEEQGRERERTEAQAASNEKKKHAARAKQAKEEEERLRREESAAARKRAAEERKNQRNQKKPTTPERVDGIRWKNPRISIGTVWKLPLVFAISITSKMHERFGWAGVPPGVVGGGAVVPYGAAGYVPLTVPELKERFDLVDNAGVDGNGTYDILRASVSSKVLRVFCCDD
jgi:hypothetical protein